MGASAARLPLVRYYSISMLVVGIWLLTSALWVPGKMLTVDVTRRDESSTPRRALLSLESEADDESVLPEGFDDRESPLEVVSEEERASLQASLPRLYHSPEVFALSYEEMWNGMHVWVYPEQEGEEKFEHRLEGLGEDLAGDLTSTADLFFRLLMRSEFVTESPVYAHLFLLPVSIDALWVNLGPVDVAEHLRKYIAKIRSDFPHWNSSLGADHFYLSCHAFDPNKHRNMLELTKNAVQAACAPLKPNQQFYPHKDIVFPHYNPITYQEIRAALTNRTRERETLAYFAAETTHLLDPDFDVEFDPSPHRSSVHSKLARSKFCVSLPPHESLSLIDALRFGCVPVLVSQTSFRDLPFQDFLDWREFAIVVAVEDLPNLGTILRSISGEKYRRMQYLGHQASKHLEWNNPPEAYDAFHMTLLDLWVRRHSIKYAQRTFL